jgi:aryl-alcohol dehydrogenase-like predicted oxidoreductase
MLTRREFIVRASASGVLASNPGLLAGQIPAQLISRTIPSTGEMLPIIGLGGSTGFRTLADAGDSDALRMVIAALNAGGGTVFDTAGYYGASEEVAGAIAGDLGISEEIFWATKVWVDPNSVEPAMRAAVARDLLARSFERIGARQIDLIQLHDITDLDSERSILNELKELKEAGRIRYIGATSIRKEHYPDLEQVMREEPIDFIGVDYAIDNRSAASMLLPLAADLGLGVLSYRPFGNSRLWSRVAGREVPEWAAEFGATTWAQFFIKYVAANPVVTVVTPGTSKVENMIDNMGGGIGELPNSGMRQRMEQFVDALPLASQ